MELNPKRFEPSFLKLDSLSPGAGFNRIITSNILNYTKKKRIQEKKPVLYIQKTFNTIFKNGFNPVLGSIPRLPKERPHACDECDKRQDLVRVLIIHKMFFLGQGQLTVKGSSNRMLLRF